MVRSPTIGARRGLAVRPRLGWMVSVLLLMLARWPAGEAVEVELVIPDPLPVGVTFPGELRISGDFRNLTNLSVADHEHLELAVDTRNYQRSSRTSGPGYDLTVAVRGQAKQAGQLEIPVATVTADGKEYQSDSYRIEVTDERLDFLSGQVVAGVRFEPPLIIPGQSTIAKWRVYIRRASGWHEQADWLPPLPDWAVPMGPISQRSGYALDERGDVWNVLTARRAITAEEAGSRVWGGEIQLHQLDRLGRSRDQESFPVNPGTLMVRAIDGLERPADDQGLVGPIAIHAELDRSTIRLGEGATLEVVVEGRQAPLLSELPAPEMPGLRVYAIDLSGEERGDSKQRRFRWQLVPRRVGSFELPSFSLPWLDPQQREFVRATSPALTLKVLPGRDRGTGLSAPLTVSPPSASLPPPLALSGGQSVSRQTLCWVLVSALLLAAGLGLALRYRHWRPAAHRGRALARALAGADWASANTLAYQLIPLLEEGSQRERCWQALRHLERARFGDQTVADQVIQQLTVLQEYR